jgi:putative transposase
MRSYKFRIYPSKLQEKQLNTRLWLAKNLWNDLLVHSKETYRDFDKFPTRNSLQLMVKDSGLFSQTAQEIAHRLEDGIWRYVKLRKAGSTKAGFPRFKSIDRMRSLHYPQFGFSLDEKLKVTPFGEISIVKHREIKGKIKTLTLKKEASGKWFACFAVDETPIIKAPNGKPRIGIDLGLETLATLSNDTRIENPRLFRKHEEMVAFLSKELSKKRKGSMNRRKAKKLLAIEHEKLRNTRTDFLYKKTIDLVKSYSFIALEDLASQELAEKNYGKSIYDASWGELAGMLAYKAESAGCQVVFVNPEGTTKTCCICGSMRDMPLSERTYLCSSCGNRMDRDLNAARNILKRATAGIAGSNASGDVPQGTSLKEEAHTFRSG